MSGGPSLVETLFQRSLDELIRSFRSNPGGESIQISRAADEIRRECRSPDPDVKSLALLKLTYLSSLHFLDPSFAAFHSLELLPSPFPAHKRIAYAAATAALPLAPGLLLLSTNQLRKDLSPSAPDPLPTLALHFLSLAASPDLARDLSPDVAALIASPHRHRLRPQATATSLRLLLLHPDSARVLLRHLIDNLQSTTPGLVSASVGVFCELSATDPASYLPLSPDFFRLLTSSPRCSNWSLIKLLKVFSRLAPLEPRLAPRIADPVCDLLRHSSAHSLALECVRTIAIALSDFVDAVRLAVDKIKLFISSTDPNLRYIGLRTLSLFESKHSWAVEENREALISSLDDSDPNIRKEALHLIMGVVFEINIVEISALLLSHSKKSDPDFCNDILSAIITTCGRNVYDLVMDFDWYVSLLGEMATVPHCAQGEEIEGQIVDIALRVEDVRPEIVSVARNLLIDPALLGNSLLHRILAAAAWVSGEYVEFSRNVVELVEALVQPRTSLLPEPVRAIYIQAVFKVMMFSFNYYVEQLEVASFENFDAIGEREEGGDEKLTSSNLEPSGKKHPFNWDSITYMMDLVESTLMPLSVCDEVEVQERSRNVLGLIQIWKEIGPGMQTAGSGELPEDIRDSEVVKIMQSVFSGAMVQVSVNAQNRVSLPEGLILEDDLSALAMILGDDHIVPTSFSLRTPHERKDKEEETPSVKSSSSLAEHRKRHGLYYLPTEKGENQSSFNQHSGESDLLLSHADGSEDQQLTDKSVVPTKPKSSKPRPVVVRIEEGDNLITSSIAKQVKDPHIYLLSGVVRDVLLGNEGESATDQRLSPESSSQRWSKDKSVTGEELLQSKETINKGDTNQSTSSASSHRHHRQSKQHKGSRGNDEKVHKHSSKDSKHHKRQKHKNKEVPLNVVSQEAVVQDFLL